MHRQEHEVHKMAIMKKIRKIPLRLYFHKEPAVKIIFYFSKNFNPQLKLYKLIQLCVKQILELNLFLELS